MKNIQRVGSSKDTLSTTSVATCLSHPCLLPLQCWTSFGLTRTACWTASSSSPSLEKAYSPVPFSVGVPDFHMSEPSMVLLTPVSAVFLPRSYCRPELLAVSSLSMPRAIAHTGSWCTLVSVFETRKASFYLPLENGQPVCLRVFDVMKPQMHAWIWT